MQKLNIVVAASEMVPFAKTGGLGDVLGALPHSLARQGHRVKMFLPHYANLNSDRNRLEKLDLAADITIGETVRSLSTAVCRDRKSGLETYFVGNDHYFGRPGLYTDPATGSDFVDNDERFVFFCRGVLRILAELDFKPDVIHVHDWQAGLIPVYLKTTMADDPFFARTKTVLTIHNLAHQGTFAEDRIKNLDLPKELFYATGPMEFYGKANFLKGAIHYADKITTVSKRYAEEIQTEEFGSGLHGVLKERASDLTGILNGVDYTIWSPSRDKLIPHRYYLANLSGKRMNKVELLNRAGLPVREKTPLIGIISRLVHQKGFDLIEAAAEDLFKMNMQMIVLGMGEQKYHDLLADLEAKYPDRLKAFYVLDEKVAHQIEAGADAFLMPSLFEPCGLNQMYSLKYGTVPIVNAVGGLADTITNFDPATGEGNGFVMRAQTPKALLEAVERVIETYQRKRVWSSIMKSGMRQDFSWNRAVEEYTDLFKKLVDG